jgi:protein TonB
VNRLGATVMISALLHLLVLRGGAVPNSVTPKFSVKQGKTSVSLKVKQSQGNLPKPDDPVDETKQKEKIESSSEPQKKQEERPKNEQEEETRPDTISDTMKQENKQETRPDTTPDTTKQEEDLETGPDTMPNTTKQEQEKSEGGEDDSGKENPASPSRDQVGARMVRPAEYRRNPSPQYPMVSRRREEEGTVILEVKIDPEGNPTSVDVAESSGHDPLDRAAAETVRRWSFSPAKNKGRAQRSTVRVPVKFRID